MITSIQITGIKYEVDEMTRKYVIKRIGHLDRYIPKSARKSVSAEVTLAEVNHDHGNKYEVGVIINLPNSKITAKDSTLNIMAAIDIVEAKILSQLHDYKETSVSHIGKRGIMSHFKHSFDRELQ